MQTFQNKVQEGISALQLRYKFWKRKCIMYHGQHDCDSFTESFLLCIRNELLES